MPKQKKAVLTPAIRKERLAFARQYKDWTTDDWKRVIWTSLPSSRLTVRIPLAFFSGKVEFGKITPNRFIKHLDEHLIPYLYDSEPGWVLVHDEASYHVSPTTGEWLDSIGVVQLEWPAQSRDLNPLENVWEQVKSKLRQDHRDIRAFTGEQESIEKRIAERIEQVWDEVFTSAETTLLQSMPERMKAVIKAKGS